MTREYAGSLEGGAAAFYGWKLIGVFWLVVFINVALPMFGLSILSVYMSDQAGISRSATGSAYSAYTIMSGVPAPLAAFLIGRWGVKLTIVGGNILLALGAAALAVLPASPANLILFAGCVIGMASAIGGVMPTTAGAAFWFVERRALAIAIIMSAASVGGFIGPPLLQRLITANGGNWRLGWWCIAALGLVAAVSAAVLVVNRPQDIGQQAKGSEPAATQAAAGHETSSPNAGRRVHVTSEVWSFREVIRRPPYWLVVCCATAALAVFTIFFGQGVAHIRDLGYSMDTAASFMSAAVLIGFVAHFATGALADRIDPQFFWAGGLAAQGAGTLLFIFSGSLPILCLGVALVGAGTSISMLCILALISNWFGPAAYASVAGLASAIATVGGLSSYFAGFSYDRWGSYVPAYGAVAVPCLVCSLLMAVQKPPLRTSPEPASCGDETQADGKPSNA